MNSAESVPLRVAAELVGRSVQSIRQKGRRGTLELLPVEHEGATVQGVTLAELRRVYGAAFRDPQRLEEQRAEAAEPTSSPWEAKQEAPEEQPEEQPEAPESLAVHEVALQGWSDARDALLAVRETHALEVERLDGQRRDAARWGRLAVGALVFVAVGAAVAMIHGERRVADASRAAVAPLERMAEQLADARERAATAQGRADEAEGREAELRRRMGLAATTTVRTGLRVAAGL